MHGFIDSQALGVRKRDARVASLWHLVRIIEALESYVLRARKRVHNLDQGTQRKADPWHDDGPSFDAPVSVDSFFERGDLQKSVEIEHLGLGDSAFNRDRPGDCSKVLCVVCGIAFCGPELVEVVVVDHILIRSRSFRRAEGTLQSFESCTRDCGAAPGAESYRCEKTTAVQVDALGRDR